MARIKRLVVCIVGSGAFALVVVGALDAGGPDDIAGLRRRCSKTNRGMSVARTATPMESDVEPIRLLTLDEAAEVLQVSKRTVRRMVDQKQFPAFKVGGQWRVRESEVTKWIQELSEL